MAGELLGVAVHQDALADRRRGLLAGQVARPATQARGARDPPRSHRRTTSTISVPAARASASESTSARTRAGSSPPAAVVSDDEPTLTTTRLAPVTAARLIRRSPSGSCSVPVEPAGDVGPGLGLAALGHRLVDRPTPFGGGPGLGEALVLATAAEHLGAAGVEPGLEVEDDGVVRVADQHRVALDGPELDEPRLDAEPVEPVGEEADRLVVAEVGLPDPALRLLPADPPALAGLRSR